MRLWPTRRLVTEPTRVEPYGRVNVDLGARLSLCRLQSVKIAA
jgi:hypothetical protein